MLTLIQDVRYGLRVLRKSPGSTAIAVLALGLGVGVNTAVFSLSDVLLRRPLLVPDLDRIVIIQATTKGTGASQRVSVPDLLDWRVQAKTVEHLAAVYGASLNLTGDREPMALEAARVSPEFFDALGARAELGRTFLQEEEKQGRDHVVILSHAVWELRYGANPGILRRTVKLEGQDYQVVGVMPKDFEYPPGVQVLVPAAFDNQEKSAHANFRTFLIGRLKGGVSLSQANAEFQMLAHRSEQTYPESHANRGARVNLLREFVNGDEARPFMGMLTGAALFVLLIACANVASLQFARVSLRTREVALRSALGAGRIRLIVQFLIESMLLGIIGSLAALACAYWGTYLLRAGLPAYVARHVPGWSRLGIEWHALAYAIGLSAGSGALAGIAPAWIASKTDLSKVLGQGGRGISTGRSRQRIRGTLVATEIVLAVVLLIGAGLMVKGVQHLGEPAPNIHPESVLTFRISLPESRYAKPQQQARFQDELLNGLISLPGVECIALASAVPYVSASTDVMFTIEHRPVPKPGNEPSGQRQVVSVAYFRNLRIQLERGRLFDDRDGDGALPVAIISEHLARRYFIGEDPVGKRLRLGRAGSTDRWLTIVGIVSNIRHNPWDPDMHPVIYQPFWQAPSPKAHFLLRAAGDPRDLITAARTEVARIDPDLPVQDIKSYAEAIDDQLVGLRYVASMMAIFGAIALMLSAAGVYGVMSYSVSERTHEIGIRVALGAQARDIVWMIGRWGLLLTVCGLGLGLVAAAGFARLLENLVLGDGAYDLVSFGGGALVLCAAAMLACYVPVRRALSVDPVVALRIE